MHSGALTAVCFIGFFVLLEFARKTVKFLFPYLASYGILDITNRNQAKRLSKEYEKAQEQHLKRFKESIKIVDKGDEAG